MQDAKSRSGYVQITQQPTHGPDMSQDLDKQASSCGCQHRCAARQLRKRVLLGFIGVIVFLLVGYAVMHWCKGSPGDAWESVVGIFKRTTSSTSSSTDSSTSPFIQNKLYLIVVIVGLIAVVILGLMLSAWCCRESFENPLCCPCYLCACCGGLACLECIGCGLCAV